jgi:hypothetical protein
MKPESEIVGPVLDTGAAATPLPSQVREYIRASKAENTLRGYKSDWRHFCAWCETRALSPLPATPETVAAYIAECAGFLKAGSVQRRLNAIAEAHKTVSLEPPTRTSVVANTMKGIRRTKGTAPSQKSPTLGGRVPPTPLARCAPAKNAGTHRCRGSPRKRGFKALR